MTPLQNQNAIGSWITPQTSQIPHNVPASGYTTPGKPILPVKNENEETITIIDNLSEDQINNIYSNIKNIFVNRQSNKKEKISQIFSIFFDIQTRN